MTTIRKFYQEMCCAYSRSFVRDRPADLIMRVLCAPYFRQVHGYWPNYLKPRSFSEKVWYRMLFDRNPLWTLLSDKWAVRQYVAERAGTECLIPVLWHGINPEDIPFDNLPNRFVIKATHGCGYNIIIPDKGQVNRTEIVFRLRQWIKENYGTDVFPGIQWGYKNIKPAIIVEQFLGSNGIVPWDYKIYCFAGRVHFVEVHLDRFVQHATAAMDRNFDPVNTLFGEVGQHAPVGRPENHQELIRVAEALAEGLDFIRVDLYAVKGHIYFGELTCYHGGGCQPCATRQTDFSLGRLWELPASRGGET